MFKKILSLVFALILVLTVAGCTSDKKPTSSNTGDTSMEDYTSQNSSNNDTSSKNDTSSGNSSIKDNVSYYDKDDEGGNDGWDKNDNSSGNSSGNNSSGNSSANSSESDEDIKVPSSADIFSVVLTLNKKDGKTYSYGLTWQSDVQLVKPVIEIMPSNESNWANARKIYGTSKNSVAHLTYQIKKDYDYLTLTPSQDFDPNKSGVQRWYNSPAGLDATHTRETLYSNKLVVSGLTAGKTYKYRVGDALIGDYSSVGTFTAVDTSKSDFKFLFTPDSQQTFNAANKVAWGKTLQAALSHTPSTEFIVHGGDIINWNAIERQWTEILDGNKQYLMNLPLMPAAGNHEINMTWYGGGAVEFYDFNHHFNLSYTDSYDKLSTAVDHENGKTGTYYSYDYKKVHFIALNTNDIYISNRSSDKGKYVLGDAQMAWLKDDLATSKQREAKGEIDFTVVYMHAGLYTTGSSGLGGNYKETLNLYDQIQGLFADSNVDLVLSGHDHIYSRTKVLNKNGDVSSSGGVIYMSGGVAGVNAPNAALFETPSSINANVSKYNTKDKYAYYAKSKYTNCWTEIDVTSNAITVSTYRLGSNTAIDTFKVTKNNK